MLGDDRRLDAAVRLGIISAEQAQAIRDLAPRAATPEPSRPFAGAGLGYLLGAITVLIAMGWFLSDRWEWLGPPGVLAVALLYAALFLAVGARLGREGHPQARGVAVLLAVGMVPIAVSALNALAGWVPPPPRGVCAAGVLRFWACRGEEVLLESATVVAALVALRRTRFALLVAPLAFLGIRALFLVADAVTRAGYGLATGGWIWAVGGALLAAVAYETARRQAGDEDFASWLHLAAVVCAVMASATLISNVEPFRHLLIPGALVAFAMALRMRRVPWLLLGLGWFVVYLGWLASDVFRQTPFFPIVLAALGIGVIVLTVWVQRNSQRLEARFGGLSPDGRPTFPGGSALFLVAAAVGALQMPGAAALDAADRRLMEAQMQSGAAIRERDERLRRARGETVGGPRRRTTPPREGGSVETPARARP